jgi:S-adenosylmethionine synthetase
MKNEEVNKIKIGEVVEREGMRKKDIDRLADKISESVNQLCLENYLDMPDFVIGRMLAEHLDSVVKAHQIRDKWYG